MRDSRGSYFTCTLRRLLPRKAFRYSIHSNPRLHSYLGFGVVSRACVLFLLRCVVRLGLGWAVVCASRRVRFRVFVGIPSGSGFCVCAKTFVSFAASCFGERQLDQNYSKLFCVVSQKCASRKNGFPDFGNLPGLLAVAALRPGRPEAH